MDPINASMHIAGSGMKAQSARLRVVAENMANANTTAETPGGDPYRRKTITFQSALDDAGASTVLVRAIGTDPSAFPQKHDPAHPAADANGMVKTPNVNPLLEMMDMREAQRSYEANLSMMDQARAMLARTIDLLRS